MRESRGICSRNAEVSTVLCLSTNNKESVEGGEVLASNQVQKTLMAQVGGGTSTVVTAILRPNDLMALIAGGASLSPL